MTRLIWVPLSLLLICGAVACKKKSAATTTTSQGTAIVTFTVDGVTYQYPVYKASTPPPGYEAPDFVISPAYIYPASNGSAYAAFETVPDPFGSTRPVLQFSFNVGTGEDSVKAGTYTYSSSEPGAAKDTVIGGSSGFYQLNNGQGDRYPILVSDTIVITTTGNYYANGTFQATFSTTEGKLLHVSNGQFNGVGVWY